MQKKQQMFQGLPVALAKVKPGDTSENLLNEIKKSFYFFVSRKKITEKVYKSIMNSIKI